MSYHGTQVGVMEMVVKVKMVQMVAFIRNPINRSLFFFWWGLFICCRVLGCAYQAFKFLLLSIYGATTTIFVHT